MARSPRGARRLAAAAASLSLLSASSALAGTATFSVDAATIQSFLLAVTPYDIVVGKGGLSETLTLSNPRDVRFVNGRIVLKVDCRGTPIPLEEILQPSLSVRWNAEKKTFEAKIHNLPLKIPVLGTVELSEYLRPIEIPSTFSSLAGEEENPFSIEGTITSLRILDTTIQVSADLRFRPAGRPETPAHPARVSTGR